MLNQVYNIFFGNNSKENSSNHHNNHNFVYSNDKSLDLMQNKTSPVTLSPQDTSFQKRKRGRPPKYPKVEQEIPSQTFKHNKLKNQSIDSLEDRSKDTQSYQESETNEEEDFEKLLPQKRRRNSSISVDYSFPHEKHSRRSHRGKNFDIHRELIVLTPEDNPEDYFDLKSDNDLTLFQTAMAEDNSRDWVEESDSHHDHPHSLKQEPHSTQTSSSSLSHKTTEVFVPDIVLNSENDIFHQHLCLHQQIVHSIASKQPLTQCYASLPHSKQQILQEGIQKGYFPRLFQTNPATLLRFFPETQANNELTNTSSTTSTAPPSSSSASTASCNPFNDHKEFQYLDYDNDEEDERFVQELQLQLQQILHQQTSLSSGISFTANERKHIVSNLFMNERLFERFIIRFEQELETIRQFSVFIKEETTTFRKTANTLHEAKELLTMIRNYRKQTSHDLTSFQRSLDSFASSTVSRSVSMDSYLMNYFTSECFEQMLTVEYSTYLTDVMRNLSEITPSVSSSSTTSTKNNQKTIKQSKSDDMSSCLLAMAKYWSEQDCLLFVSPLFANIGKYWLDKRRQTKQSQSYLRAYHRYIMELWSKSDHHHMPNVRVYSNAADWNVAFDHLKVVRRDLDRVRLIVDRIRKREKLKRDLLRNANEAFHIKYLLPYATSAVSAASLSSSVQSTPMSLTSAEQTLLIRRRGRPRKDESSSSQAVVLPPTTPSNLQQPQFPLFSSLKQYISSSLVNHSAPTPVKTPLIATPMPLKVTQARDKFGKFLKKGQTFTDIEPQPSPSAEKKPISFMSPEVEVSDYFPEFSLLRSKDDEGNEELVFPSLKSESEGELSEKESEKEVGNESGKELLQTKPAGLSTRAKTKERELSPMRASNNHNVNSPQEDFPRRSSRNLQRSRQSLGGVADCSLLALVDNMSKRITRKQDGDSFHLRYSSPLSLTN